MSRLDATYIATEDAVNHMHVGSVGIFEGPVPPYETLRAAVAGKLRLIPRYRRRVRMAPAGIGRPFWIDDADFDLDSHLRHTALPAGDPFALQQLVGRVMSHPIDRRQPLWEMWLIEGVDHERWALLAKVHRCVLEGPAGDDLLAAISEREPAGAASAPDVWQPEPEPSRIEMARYAGEMTIESVADGLRHGVGPLLHPARAVDRAREAALGFARAFVPGRRPGSSLFGPIGARRRWARTRVSVDDVNAIRRAFGGGVDDIMIAAVTRGFRDLLQARGEHLADCTVTPLDHRSLPTGIADPVETLRAVCELNDESTRVFTPVPRSGVPLYVCGRRMLETYPYAPIAGDRRVGVAIWSYCHQLHVGITGDWHGAPDINRLARGIDLGVEDLLKAAARAAGPLPVSGIA